MALSQSVLSEVLDAFRAGDGVDLVRDAVRLVAGPVPLEASRGGTLETIRFLSETGVNFISVGRITQSAPAVDIGLDYSFA